MISLLTHEAQDDETFYLFFKIFVLVDDQRVRLTLGINDTEFVRNNIDKIKRFVFFRMMKL